MRSVEAQMLSGTETITATPGSWLARFERALAEPDDGLLANLFHADSHWRDVLALTWHIRTVDGADADCEGAERRMPAAPTGRLQDRSRSHRAAPCDARRHRRDRGDLHI